MNGGKAMGPAPEWELSAERKLALAERLAERAKLLRHRAVRAEANHLRAYLAFNGGSDRYGVPIEDVLEIQALKYFCAAPRTPPFIAGLLHWRGAVLSLIDLGRLFESGAVGLADFHVAIVVEAGDVRTAFVAREADEMLWISPDEIRPAPAAAFPAPPEWTAGIYGENRLLLRTAEILRDPKLVEWRKSQLS